MLTSLFSVTYAAPLTQRRRSCVTAYSCDDLLVNHDGVSIVAGTNIALSPMNIADQPTTFEIVCTRAHIGCFAEIVVLLYRLGSQLM